MKLLFALATVGLLCACETPAPKNVSVQQGKMFAQEQGYDNLALVKASTVCYYEKQTPRTYGPTFDAVLNGQPTRITVCEKAQPIWTWHRDDLMRVGPRNVLERVDRTLFVIKHTNV